MKKMTDEQILAEAERIKEKQRKKYHDEYVERERKRREEAEQRLRSALLNLRPSLPVNDAGFLDGIIDAVQEYMDDVS